MYTIVGSGFGLYGYLPALAEELDEQIVLPLAFRAKLQARSELADTFHRVHWADSEATALSLADAVVIAMPPRRQFDVVSECLRSPGIDRLVLEKPLAVTPALAAELLAKLRESRKRYRIGYSFLHAAWHSVLSWPRRSTTIATVRIDWTFMAHHFAQDIETWKRTHAEGGGALRFYGIHLVALVADAGYDSVRASYLEGDEAGAPERWRGVFSGPGLPDCHVLVDSRCATRRFEIVHRASNEDVMVRLHDPFDMEADRRGGDIRVGLLRRLIGSFAADDQPFEMLYDRVNALWQKVEAAMSGEHGDARCSS